MMRRQLRRSLNSLLLLLIIGINLAWIPAGHTQETDQEVPIGAVGGTVHADLFTGTATTSIPIDVPPGRQGIQPELALVYGSANGNGWIGMGWKLEKGVIDRQTKFGVDYSGDDYVFRLSGINVELVNIGTDEYRAKIEGGFTKVEKLTATDGKPYFEAMDKTGKTFYFGQEANTRVADPSDANNIFRWCLDRVEDPNGNYMTITYSNDQGQAYLDTISYTGNTSLAPTNTVKFHLEDRTDAPPMYVPNFEMTTAKRLKTIEVQANGTLVRAYALNYVASGSTNHSVLSSVQQFGMDATIDGSGAVGGGTGLPPITLTHSAEGDATFAIQNVQYMNSNMTQSNWEFFPADFDGDGIADFCGSRIDATGGGGWVLKCALNQGDGTFVQESAQYMNSNMTQSSWKFSPADLNGDGITDFCGSRIDATGGGGWILKCALNQGDALFAIQDIQYMNSNMTQSSWKFSPADLNGDGITDFCGSRIDATGGGGWILKCALNQGDGTFVQESAQYMNSNMTQSNWQFFPADFDGDGIADFCGSRIDATGGGGWVLKCALNQGDPPFLLQSITNGLGATTTIDYTPSTEYSNTQLPFPTQTVSKITTNDGNGNVAETTYAYEGGFHHIGERDFRGFHKVTVTGQAGPSGEQTITETWFHQGNDTAVNVNDPNVADGYLKGAPYRTKVTDGAGNLYTQTTTTYTADADSLAPFFSPPASVVTDICDGNGCSTTTQTDFTYDIYGNVTREDQYGDTGTSTDDRTVVRTFNPNTTAWILGLPTSETIYQGLGTGNQMARTDFYYDGTTSCGEASSNTQPTHGNLTRVVRWLNGGTSPETRMAYDTLGNVICTRDAKRNTTTMAYDSSGTFATTVTNPFSHVTTTQYYGVNGVAMDTGLYGQVKSVTDPNGVVVSSAYDALGRRTSVTQPDGFWTTTSYNSFGTVGSQHVRTDSSLGLSTWTYFDGLGRTIIAKSTGTDSQTIVTHTEYDARGAVTRTSIPVFDPATPTLWSTNTYDPMGRAIRTDNPDGSRGLACHDDFVSASIDANDHKKRTVRDAYGRVVTVQEYTGTFTTCTTSAGSPYATTTYSYDVLGNLLSLTDAKGNVSTMQYDTLSRKTSMHDPDMGTWSYKYDKNGNLTRQKDAKNQKIYFRYDKLNRRVQKDYGTRKAVGSGDVVYTYDGSTNHRKGRLQQVNDSSGTTTFFYDVTGRVTKTDKVVDSTTYTTQSSYDGLGRVTAITYPDTSTVTQTYNGPQLKEVKEGSTTYASYGGFNALGQPSTLTLGNGVATTYTYDAQNFRLKTLTTVKGSTTLQDLGYTFDTGGNVTALTDATHGNQSYSYDDIDRLTSATGNYGTITYTYNEIGNMLSNSQVGTYSYPASGSSSVRPHAVSTAGAHSYTYDANGNMLTGAGRILTYDDENRPDTVIKGGVTSTFVYDGDGGRVKKTVNNGGTLTATTYIGKLYVCDGTMAPLSCAKMIFAGSQRVAMVQVDTSAISYFHPDHLGSTSVLTDASGTSEQDVAYYPYGDTRSNTGTADVAYKYTGKEQDDSTGLYFYEARYYDPVLGRFISPDTIVQDPLDPQTLNRYSYARNNPILYNDPSGYWFGIDDAIAAVVGAVVGAVVAAVTGQDILLGAAAGAVSAWAGWNTGGAAFLETGNIFYGATAGIGSSLASSSVYAAAGYDVDFGRNLLAGAGAGLVGAGVGSTLLGPVAGVAAAGATGAAISGGDPGYGALLAVGAAGLAVGVLQAGNAIYKGYQNYLATKDQGTAYNLSQGEEVLIAKNPSNLRPRTYREDTRVGKIGEYPSSFSDYQETMDFINDVNKLGREAAQERLILEQKNLIPEYGGQDGTKVYGPQGELQDILPGRNFRDFMIDPDRPTKGFTIPTQ